MALKMLPLPGQPRWTLRVTKLIDLMVVALVEQSAAAAQTLAEQARELNDSVAAFRLAPTAA